MQLVWNTAAGPPTGALYPLSCTSALVAGFLLRHSFCAFTLRCREGECCVSLAVVWLAICATVLPVSHEYCYECVPTLNLLLLLPEGVPPSTLHQKANRHKANMFVQKHKAPKAPKHQSQLLHKLLPRYRLIRQPLLALGAGGCTSIAAMLSFLKGV